MNREAPSVSEAQRNHFDAFGFLCLRRYLSAAELDAVGREFDAAMAGVEAPPGENRSRILMSGDTPRLTALAEDRRFATAAEDLLGRRAICVQVAGYQFMGDTRWHSDNYDLLYDGVKFCLYLDRLTTSSGALRVLPGSHRNPLWQESGLVGDTTRRFGVAPQDMPAAAIETRPGDVVAFRHALWHASFHGADFRRMVEINFYADPDTDEEEVAFRLQMRRNHSPSAHLGRQLYSAFWRTVDREPRRRWVSRLREIGVLDTPGAPPVEAESTGA